MREKSRLPSQAPGVHADVVLQSQLARYTFASDPVQLRSAKARLEDLLAQSLTQLMRRFLEFCEDQLDGDHDILTDEQHQQRVENDVRLLRPTGTQLPFANGCGSDAASIYAGCVFGVLQRVEVRLTQLPKANSRETKGLLGAEVPNDHCRAPVREDGLAQGVSREGPTDTTTQRASGAVQGRASESTRTWSGIP
jgi:hypothetical protein